MPRDTCSEDVRASVLTALLYRSSPPSSHYLLNSQSSIWYIATSAKVPQGLPQGHLHWLLLIRKSRCHCWEVRHCMTSLVSRTCSSAQSRLIGLQHAEENIYLRRILEVKDMIKGKRLSGHALWDLFKHSCSITGIQVRLVVLNCPAFATYVFIIQL